MKENIDWVMDPAKASIYGGTVPSAGNIPNPDRVGISGFERVKE